MLKDKYKDARQDYLPKGMIKTIVKTFVPIVTHASVRMLLSIAAAKKMKVKHLDIKTAFLHRQTKEDLCMD